MLAGGLAIASVPVTWYSRQYESCQTGTSQGCPARMSRVSARAAESGTASEIATYRTALKASQAW